jgi:sulfur relay (sulfurtransferase) DsrF/TusC family protein
MMVAILVKHLIDLLLALYSVDQVFVHQTKLRLHSFRLEILVDLLKP